MSERLPAFVLYTGFLLVTVWVGSKVIGYFADYRFYSTFLVPWQQAMQDYQRQYGDWPRFDGGRHVEYMIGVTGLLRERVGFRAPGEGRGAFMYQLKKPGATAQNIFLLAQSGRIVLYGLSRDTALRVDAHIDGRRNLDDGRFRARPGREGDTLIAAWDY